MSKRTITVFGILLIAVLLLALAAMPVLAMDARGEQSITVESGEVVDDDLYVMGNEITINGTVNGDVFGLARTFILNGSVKGTTLIAAQTIIVNGHVSRSARLAGQTIDVSGNIGGDLLVFGTAVNVHSQAKIANDLVLGAQTARVEGIVGGDVSGGGNEVTVNNAVGGNVALSAEKLTIASAAKIEGDLSYTSEAEANIESGAYIAGKTTHKLPEAKKPAEHPFLKGLRGKAIGFLMIFLIGLIVVLCAPRAITSLADAIRIRPGQSLGWGAVLLFATPLAAVIVCFTLIGIPLALIGLVIYGVAIYLSQIPVALLIGLLIIKRSTAVESKGLLIGALATGLVILVIFRWIPFVGFWIGLATVLFGLGSLIVWGKALRK